MRIRALVLCLLAYVLVDFANPMIPGAVAFDPEECTEGIGTARATAPALSALPASVPPRSSDLLATASHRVGAARDGRALSRPRPWLAPARRAHAVSADPPSAPEDH